MPVLVCMSHTHMSSVDAHLHEGCLYCGAGTSPSLNMLFGASVAACSCQGPEQTHFAYCPGTCITCSEQANWVTCCSIIATTVVIVWLSGNPVHCILDPSVSLSDTDMEHARSALTGCAALVNNRLHLLSAGTFTSEALW